MKSRIGLVIRWLLLAAMCIGIFIFSSLAADESSEQSGFIVDTVIKLFFYDFENKTAADQTALISLLTVVVRKGAHFSEYALMGVLSFGAFVKIKKYIPRYFVSLLFCIVYAASDELHQMFVPGRAGMVRDVVVDSCGAAFGVLIACFISLMIAASSVLRNTDMYVSKIDKTSQSN